MPYPVDPGILTNLLNAFMAAFTLGSSNISGDATRFLYIISAIEITVAALFWALKGEDALIEFIKKTLVIGVFAWFVLNWSNFLNSVGQGFVDLGFKAGGGAASIANFNDPSSIITMGFNAVSPIDAKIQTLNYLDVGPYIIYGWAMISILAAFAILGIQVFLTQLEFYLITTLALAFVPFGILRWTSFMSEKAFGMVFSLGVKMMVLAFIISVSPVVLGNLVLPGDPTYGDCFNVLIGAAAIAFLAWHAPGIAAGMVSGGPSLTASVATRTAAAGLIAGLAGASATGAAMDAAKRGTLSGVKGLSALSAGAQFGSATAAMGGGGMVAQTMGGLRGAGRVIGNTAMSPAAAVATSFKNAWSSGQIKGFQAVGLPAGNNTAGASSATSQNFQQSMSNMAGMAMKASHVIPSDAHPSGGATPNLKS